MGWLIALAVLTALALLPVGVSLRYEGEVFSIRIRVGPVQFTLSLGSKNRKPRKEENQEIPRKQQPPEAPAAPPEPSEPQTPAAIKQKRPLSDYQPFVRLALDFLGSLRRKLRINNLTAKIILAGQDPCDLATLYGCTWAGVSNLMAHVNRLFEVKHQDVNVECDFTAEKTLLSGRLDLTLTIGRIVSLGLGYGLRALKEFLIFKKRKGGAAL